MVKRDGALIDVTLSFGRQAMYLSRKPSRFAPPGIFPIYGIGLALLVTVFTLLLGATVGIPAPTQSNRSAVKSGEASESLRIRLTASSVLFGRSRNQSEPVQPEQFGNEQFFPLAPVQREKVARALLGVEDAAEEEVGRAGEFPDKLTVHIAHYGDF